MDRIESVQTVHDRLDGGPITGGLFQRQNVDRLRRIAVHNFLANSLEHAAIGHRSAARAGECSGASKGSDQTGKRGCKAINVVHDVVSYDPDRSGLGGSDRCKATAQKKGDPAREEADGDRFHDKYSLHYFPLDFIVPLTINQPKCTS